MVDRKNVPPPKAGFWSSIWGPLATSLLFFLVLWTLGFPEPMRDDLFYCGAALNLASGGDFSNPLLARQGFPSHFFFVYPPLHSYAVAGWLSVVGISANSLLAFQFTMYLIIAGSTIVLLHRHRAPLPLLYLSPLGLTAIFLPIGLRPEPFAIALTMAGYCLFVCGGKSVPAVLLSFLMLFLGATAAPRVTIFALAMAAQALWELFKYPPPTRAAKWSGAGLAGLALGATLAICAGLIGFRFAEFNETFKLHASRVTGHRMGQLEFFCTTIIETRKWPLLGLAPLILVLLFRGPRDGMCRLAFALAAACVLTGAVGGLGHGTAWYIVLILLAGLATVPRQLSRRKGAMLLGYFALVLLAANLADFARVGGILSGRIRSERTPALDQVRTIRPTAKHAVLIDDDVARYVYDFRLGPGFLDWWFTSPFPGVSVTDTALNESDIYVICPPAIDQLNRKTYLNQLLPKWRPFGTIGQAFYQFPYRPFIIDPKTCHGPRKDPEPPPG